MRHARFAALEDVRADDVAELVRAAVELNRRLGDPAKRG
jgi:hypothetical protein